MLWIWMSGITYIIIIQMQKRDIWSQNTLMATYFLHKELKIFHFYLFPLSLIQYHLEIHQLDYHPIKKSEFAL